MINQLYSALLDRYAPAGGVVYLRGPVRLVCD
nr:MAG TPA: hypothetical protein [Caudoviricetes sp.]